MKPASTGTYYHRTSNLSYKPVTGKKCSVVVAFRGAPDKAILQFGQAINGRAGDLDVTVNLNLNEAPDGKNYLSAWVGKQ